MFASITIRTNQGQEWSTTVRATQPIIVGRHAGSTVRLNSDQVSREHVVVVAGLQGMRVEDRSTNGTFVAGKLVHRSSVDVLYGSPIQLGEFTLNIELLTPNHPAVRTLATLPPAMPAPDIPTVLERLPARSDVAPSMAASAPNGVARVKEGLGNAVAQKGVASAREADAETRRTIHKQLLAHLDLGAMDAKKLDDQSMRPTVLAALRAIVAKLPIAPGVDTGVMIGQLVDEALGLGPLEEFLADPTVTEIMVLDPNTIYVERSGKIVLTEARFTDDDRVRAVIERILTPLGRRIDESSPMVDARLKDGSRVNAIIKPLALRGSCITIRKFSKTPLTMEKLFGYGTLDERMGLFLTRSVQAKKNIIISGGTGSGKTTLLNVLSAAIPEHERIVTIEDTAELQLTQPHVASLETKPPNLEGRGEYSIRDLLRNALRMRPDRIIVGECRGGEALDMLQAMNTGHDGSLTTTHANSPAEAVRRLETLVLMAGMDLPLRAIREQIAGSVHLIVQQSRLGDGSRKITAITELVGLDDATGEVELRPIFEFHRTSTERDGKTQGGFRATGYLPSFLDEFITLGLIQPGAAFL